MTLWCLGDRSHNVVEHIYRLTKAMYITTDGILIIIIIIITIDVLTY